MQQILPGNTNKIHIFHSFKIEQRRALYSFIEKQESAHTKKHYCRDLVQFCQHYRIDDFSIVTREHVANYRSHLKDQYATASVARKVTTLRSFFNWLEEVEVLNHNPAKLIKAPKQDNQEGKTAELSDQEVRRLLAMPNRNKLLEFRDFVMMELLFYTGLRSSEIRFLRKSDLSQEKRVYVLKVLGKGNRYRRIPIKDFIFNDLQDYLAVATTNTDPDDYLFTPSRNNRTKELNGPLTDTALRCLIRKYARLAGIEDQVCAHTARVTACGHAIEHGATEDEIMNLMGWRSPEMPRRYNRRKNQIRNSAAHRINY